MNKCEELKIEHAWRNTIEISNSALGIQGIQNETCANCNLARTHCSAFKEWYSYSDGRPDEPIINMKPV